MCVIDYDEYPKVWEEAERTARKPYKCSCCCRAIPVGEKYLSHFSVFDDAGTSYEKLCGDCLADRAEFSSAHDGILPMPSGFLEILAECAGDDGLYNEETDTTTITSEWGPMLERIDGRRAAAKLLKGESCCSAT